MRRRINEKHRVSRLAIMEVGFKWWESTGQVKRLIKNEAKETVDEYLLLEKVGN